jgi:hypothetical protein
MTGGRSREGREGLVGDLKRPFASEGGVKALLAPHERGHRLGLTLL